MGTLSDPLLRACRGLACGAVVVVALAGCASAPPGARSKVGPVPQQTGSAGSGPVAYQRFAGATEDSSTSQIFVRSPDGAVHRVTDVEGGAFVPAWSPDGSRIAFESGAPGPRHQLFTTKSDGTDLHALAGGCTGTNRCALDTAPAYSPDGRRISFERVYGPFVHRFDPGLMTTLDFASRVDLMVVDANGGMPAVLWSWGLDPQPRDGAPRWSPDGAHVVLPLGTFEHPNKHTLLGAALFVLDLKRGAQRRITPWALGAGNPDWSPDGRRIAFNSEGGHSPSIYVVDADGGRLTRVLAGATRRGIIGQTQSPVWSPDGRQLAFTSEPDPCHSLHIGACGNAVFTLNLYVMNADGSRVRRLTSARRFESHPVWGTGP